MGREGFAFVVAEVVAPYIGIDPGVAQERLANRARHKESYGGNLPELLNIDPQSIVGSAYSVEEWVLELPNADHEPGCDIVMLVGDSYAKHYDFLFARLLKVITETKVDCRQAGWISTQAVARVMAEFAIHTPKLWIMVLTERRFGGGS